MRLEACLSSVVGKLRRGGGTEPELSGQSKGKPWEGFTTDDHIQCGKWNIHSDSRGSVGGHHGGAESRGHRERSPEAELIRVDGGLQTVLCDAVGRNPRWRGEGLISGTMTH